MRLTLRVLGELLECEGTAREIAAAIDEPSKLVAGTLSNLCRQRQRWVVKTGKRKQENKRGRLSNFYRITEAGRRQLRAPA